MTLAGEFKQMIRIITAEHQIPEITGIFLPPFQKGGQTKTTQFMAMKLADGSAGVSYILLDDGCRNEYAALNPDDFVGKDPVALALEFGSREPVLEMLSLAAVNTVCGHILLKTGADVASTTDSLGLLNISKKDRIGMVGLFSMLVPQIKRAGADLVIIEKNAALQDRYPDLPVSLDPGELALCNKVLCTSTTILNDTLDTVLDHCAPDAFVCVVGPTAGYLPDPLFARGVDVVGGRVITDGDRFMDLISNGRRWGDTTIRTCFQKKAYAGYRQIAF